MRISDWSSDVCSSDLLMELIERRLQIMAVERLASALHVPALSCRTSRRLPAPADRAARNNLANWFTFLRVLVAVRLTNPAPDRKSVVEGKRVSVRVALGGRRIIKKKKKQKKQN